MSERRNVWLGDVLTLQRGFDVTKNKILDRWESDETDVDALVVKPILASVYVAIDNAHIGIRILIAPSDDVRRWRLPASAGSFACGLELDTVLSRRATCGSEASSSTRRRLGSR